VQGGDLSVVAYGDAGELELVNEVVGHRLAQVGAAVEQCHDRAAARKPDCGLAGGVATSDDGNPRCAAKVGLRRVCCIEDAQPLELRQPLVGWAAVLRASRSQNRARGDLVTLLEPDEVASVAWLQRHGT